MLETQFLSETKKNIYEIYDNLGTGTGTFSKKILQKYRFMNLTNLNCINLHSFQLATTGQKSTQHFNFDCK